MLGLHQQHVAAVALGDDLVLQVLRRVLAAQVRVQRLAQLGPLPSQADRESTPMRGSRRSTTSPDGAMAWRTAVISCVNVAVPPTSRFKRGNSPGARRTADALASTDSR